ncbi:MAG: glycosyltransferase family 2 protein [Actinomycetota bacterium]
MTSFARGMLVTFEGFLLVYFASVNLFYLVQLLLAGLEVREHQKRLRLDPLWRVLDSSVAPRITVLSPAHNEQLTIISSVRALLGLDYPNLRVVVINDGSGDATLEVLLQAFDLRVAPGALGHIDTERVRGVYRSPSHPHLIVVDKENGGKADALNAGLNQVRTDLVCAIDADTLIERDALQRMVRPFLLEESGVLAAGGTIRVANGSKIVAGRVVEAKVPRRWLARVQVVEYLRAFLFGRTGWNRMGGNLIVSGAFGLFKTEDLIAAGGYEADTVGEDAELVARLRRNARLEGRSDRVVFVPDPVAWTEVPSRFRTLRRQRARWHRGLAQVLSRHRRMIFNPRFGALGLVVMPYFLLVELIAPVIESMGLAALAIGIPAGFVNTEFAIAYFLVAYGLGAIVSLAALLAEEVTYHRYRRARSRIRLVLAALAENTGYRQLTVLWRFQGLIEFLRRREHWGHMERAGFEGAASTEIAPDQAR